MKLTVVGGGSTYTPELVDGLVRSGSDLVIDELVCCSIRTGIGWPWSVGSPTG